jgi:hypothetical protein
MSFAGKDENERKRLNDELRAFLEGPHPDDAHLLQFFTYAHLPEHLQAVSRPFCELATAMVHGMKLEGPELTAGLRKLLEAKDCAVRAMVGKGGK